MFRFNRCRKRDRGKSSTVAYLVYNQSTKRWIILYGVLFIAYDISAIGIQRYEQLFKEYACAGSIRVARDLFALLPVKYVIVYAKMDDEVVLQAKFDRDEIQKINFKAESGMAVIDRFIFND